MVSNFRAEIRFITTIVFSWSPSQKNNGILIAYELTYRINSSSLIIRNFTDVSTSTFTLELVLNTNITDISVRAYTRVGPGDAATDEDVVIPPTLPICEIQQTSSNLDP